MARTMVTICVLLGAATQAHADVFAFKDVDGFEKCMRLEHLVETVDTAKGSQTRVLDQYEIQTRCLGAAVNLLAKNKNKDEMLEFIAVTKRTARWESAIELVGVLAATSLPACNQMSAYEVVMRALERPRRDGFFSRAKPVVKHCLADKTFRADFLEEKDSADATLRAHACELLLEAKLVKSCPKVNP